MSKHIVLIYPDIIRGWQSRPRMALPMSLLCVAAPVLKAGYTVTIIDQRSQPEWKAVLLEELKKKPLCIGVTSMTGPQLRYALEVSRFVKENSSIPVVWGGTHATLLPEQTLKNEYIDFVIEGEGEETFLEFVQALEARKPVSGVRGIWFKDQGKIKNTGQREFIDLNAQEALPYHLVDVRKHSRKLFDIEHLDFFTSRGCPHQCAFCYNVSFNNKKWRVMEPDLAVKRLKDFVKAYNVKGIFFNDSNLFFDIARARKILEGIVKEKLDVSISHINIDFFTLSKMNGADFDLLKKVNCRRIPVAVESGSKRIQTLLKKPIDRERLCAINRDLRKYDFALHYAFMMGFPTETKEDLRDSFSLASSLLKENPNADTSFNIFTPFPGTELFNIVIDHGLRHPQSIEEWFSFNYRNLTQGAPWLSDEMRRLVGVLDFCAFFLGDRPFIRPYEETSPWIPWAARAYAPIARQRIKNFWDKLPIEIGIAKRLGLYGANE